MATQYGSPVDALNALASSLRIIQQRQLLYDRATKSQAEAAQSLERAHETFNEIRNEVIQLCPEVAEGFPVGETVAVVDGKISVVKDSNG